MHGRILLTAAALTVVLAISHPNPSFVAPAAEKMKPEELIAKHLESIGTAAARAAVKSRMITGSAQVVFRLGARGQLNGKSLIAAEGNKFRLGLNFDKPEYLGEQVAWDGKSMTASEIRPGLRSNLTQFLYQNGFLLQDGLLGGVTSTNWFFLDLTSKQSRPKIEYGGLKTVDGKKLHELKYQVQQGAATFQISFYFDPVTFQHVLSIHNQSIPAFFGSGGGSAEGFIRIREEFGVFKIVDGLTLPHSYKLTFSTEGQATFLADWAMQISEIRHNQPLDASLFKLQ
jgi:hypothetical protein